MEKKKIMIIDDSALMRRVLSDIINSDERFCAGPTATNGLEALDIIMKDSSQVSGIILDINMPKMNGLEFLQELNRRKIQMTVLVVSTVARQGARETIKALEYGAFDFVTKPDSFIEAKGDRFQKKVLECLAAGIMKDNGVNFTPFSKREAEPVRVPERRLEPSVLHRKKIGNATKLVALACSTGGPKALQSVIPFLPKNLNAAFLVVQHMPEGFTNSLAGRLNEMSEIRVKEAENGENIEKGTVYIAKGGSQMRLKKTGTGYHLTVTEEPARNGLKPCADILYESLAELDYEEVTCAILTGMGGDGTKGIQKLSEQNNIYVIAQNAETCTVYGMPKVIAESGLVDEVLPLKQIADAITRHVGVR